MLIQTLNSISAEKNSTVIFPLPIGMMVMMTTIVTTMTMKMTMVLNFTNFQFHSFINLICFPSYVMIN